MIFDAYPFKIKDAFLKPDEESYEIPDYDGARVSKLLPPGKLLLCRYEEAQTLIEMMNRGCRLSGNGQCVGWRSSKSEYSWLTYKEFLSRAMHFGAGLENLGINLGQTTRISIYSPNSVQWLMTQYGCFYYSSPVVPLYDTIGPEARTFMINNAETSVVVCDQEKRVKALIENSNATPHLKYIIHVNDISDELKDLGKKKGISLHLFTDVAELGKSVPVITRPAKPTDVAIICYTSGTTGNPKGAILTHSNLIAGISGMFDIMSEELLPNKNDVSISYLPLAHAYEQLVEIFLFMGGGSIGFYSGDVSMLTEDMKILKPTIFAAVPRVLCKIHDKVESQIKKLKSKVIANGNVGIPSTSDFKPKEDEVLYDPMICKSVSDSLGGKIKLIVSGAAPISDKILKFYRAVCNCAVMEVYGQTECSGPSNANILTPETVGCVGAPLMCNMIKLEDVPELGYFKENNIGEVCLKGPNVFKGYLKNPEKTAEVIDEDGWLHTGDVGAWLPNGTLKIVDRKKHIFKLAQGEYIMPEKIENIYSASPYISQILVHGDSLQNFLVAIIIPEKSEVLTFCKKNAIDATWTEICKNEMVKELILDDMKQVAKAGGLLSFQQVKDIYVHPEGLTVEDGYLTPTQKTKRDIVKRLFMNEINAMYNINN